MAINEVGQQRCSVAALQRDALEVMQKSFCCNAALFIIRSEQHYAHDFDRMAQRGLTDDFGERYVAGAGADDPGGPYMRDHPERRFGVVRLETMGLAKRWVNSRYYKELFAPFGIRDMLCLELVVDNRQIGVIALCRTSTAGPFLDRDESKGALCRSAIAQALGRALDAEAASENDRRLADAVSDATDTGIVALDARLRVIYKTRATDILLGQMAPARVGASETDLASLPPELQLLANRLRRRALVTPSEQWPSLNQELKIATASGVVLASINAVRLACGDTRYIISLRREADPSCDKRKLLSLGLSPREADVVLSVIRGLRNVDIADSLCMSINTVQTHLRSVFAKLNVYNRASLLSRVLSDACPDSPTVLRRAQN
jgi:DNA-binding NarL/FixJ family response regulator